MPQVNSSASADIAFLLLVFFLITSSMGTEKGIYKRLSPPTPENSVTQAKEIKKRDLLVITIDGENRIYSNDKHLEIRDVKNLAINFIENPNNVDSLPEKENKEINHYGSVLVTANHIISLKTSRDANYDTYISVQNELVAAYNSLREQSAQKYFHQSFLSLTADKQAAIRDIYPQRISESEILGQKEEDAK